MKITINKKEYETEDMTKYQRSFIAEIQTVDKVLQVLSDEVQVRRLSVSAISKTKEDMVNSLIESLEDPKKVPVKKKAVGK